MDNRETTTDMSNRFSDETKSEKEHALNSIIHVKITPSQTEIPFNEAGTPLECLVKIKVDNSERRDMDCKLSLAIVLDSSGSMNSNGKLENSKQAIVKVYYIIDRLFIFF